VLPCLIDDKQSTLVLRRMIIDNMFAAYEILRYVKTKRTGRRGWVAAKLDTNKACDRIKWEFLERTMRGIEFPNVFCELGDEMYVNGILFFFH